MPYICQKRRLDFAIVTAGDSGPSHGRPAAVS
jgi:hypothetical protein